MQRSSPRFDMRTLDLHIEIGWLVDGRMTTRAAEVTNKGLEKQDLLGHPGGLVVKSP